MALDGVVQQLDAQTTRRTIVKTGAKIAYAAPLVAASFKLQSAMAQSISNQHPECVGATCASFIQCSSSNGDCVCITTPVGGFCVPGSTSCSIIGPCDANNACPDGSVCAIDTCCIDPVCVPTSLTGQCPLGDAGGADVRQSTGQGTIGG